MTMSYEAGFERLTVAPGESARSARRFARDEPAPFPAHCATLACDGIINALHAPWRVREAHDSPPRIGSRHLILATRPHSRLVAVGNGDNRFDSRRGKTGAMRMNSRTFSTTVSIALIAWLNSLGNVAVAADAPADTTLLEEKAKALVSEMTLEEKIGMVVGDGRFVPGFDPATNDAGKGMILEDQRAKLVIPRLSIRTTVMSDGPAGLNREPRKDDAKEYQYTTAFPTSTCLAATWNAGLAERVGEAFGNEVLEYDYDLIFAPGLNIHRNPKDGRGFEYYSEDPFLSGKMAASMVNGLQSNGIGATLKHFCAHNQQTNRRTYNAVISQRALREIYLRGFEIAVKESHPKAIMSSYNRLNGFYTAENPELLDTIVRREWGFEGLLITDFDGLGSAAAKVRAGSDLLMSGNEQECNELKKALNDKTLDERALDESLCHCIALKLDSPRAKGYVPTAKPDL